MTAIGDLLGRAAVEQLAAVRAAAAERERQDLDAAAATPVQPVCPTCGARRDIPAAVFRSAP